MPGPYESAGPLGVGAEVQLIAKEARGPQPNLGHAI